MSDIDWSKPVEMVDNGGVAWPVVASFEQPDGSRLLVVKSLSGIYTDVRYPCYRLTFRNMRRKVKHEAWIALSRSGNIAISYHREPEGWCVNAVEVRHIEWEADADE